MIPVDPSKPKNVALFLDRDKTLIDSVVDGESGRSRPVNKPGEVRLLPGVANALSRLYNRPILLVVVTNQGGIELGYTSSEEVARVHATINDMLLVHNSRTIDAFYACPHFNVVCDCRKPKPGMFLKAAEDLDIDLAKSFMIGDDVRDMEAAYAAGVRKRFLVVGDGEIPLDCQATDVHRDTATAIKTVAFMLTYGG